jgi:hypothetical protein
VGHNGSLAGYRTSVVWFPDQQFSAVCLCNNGGASPLDLARSVAEIYLAGHLKDDRPATRPVPVPLTAEEVRVKAGLFRNEQRGYLEIELRDGRLFPRGAPVALFAVEKLCFSTGARDKSEMVFDAAGNSVEVRVPGQPPLVYERVTRPKIAPQQLRGYAGDYRSSELDASYRFVIKEGELAFEFGDHPAIAVAATGHDRFRALSPGVEFLFHRDPSGLVDAFHLNAGRLRGVAFERLIK